MKSALYFLAAIAVGVCGGFLWAEGDLPSAIAGAGLLAGVAFIACESADAWRERRRAKRKA